ncbi:thiazolylpeptide-type bacteriocin [Streptomyces collinus]
MTSLRDTAALPENGASWGSCSCQGSSSCAQPQVTTPVVLRGRARPEHRPPHLRGSTCPTTARTSSPSRTSTSAS